MSGWFFQRGKPTFSVIGYDLRGREDNVCVAVSQGKKTLFSLKYMIVDFVWREAKPLAECVGDETRLFVGSGRLDGRLSADRRQALKRIASDLAARKWDVERARDTMVEAARRHKLPTDVTAGMSQMVQQAFREPGVMGRCTEAGRFKVVSAQLCYGSGSNKLASNAVTRAGVAVLVPPSLKFSEELRVAVQQEIDDPRRNEFVQSALEQQYRENRKTVDLLQGRSNFLQLAE